MKFESSNLEEKTLVLIDDLDLKEKDYAKMDAEVKQHEEKLIPRNLHFEIEISRHDETIKSNEALFNALIVKLLSPTDLNSEDNRFTGREGHRQS